MRHNNERWMTRLASVASWIEATGSLPRRTSGEELSLYLWIADQRRFHRARTLDPVRAAHLQGITGLLRGPVIDRLGQLAEFQSQHGRLPKTTASDDHERGLGIYLVQALRTSIRRGTITRPRLERALQIPGVAEINTVPDQHRMLARLREHVRANGHLPVRGDGRSAGEVQLAHWMRNNLTGDPGLKSPARRRRHLAIQSIVDSAVPAPGPAARIDELEAFCQAAGHLPSRQGAEASLSAVLASCIRRRDAGRLDKFTLRRLERILRHPSKVDYRWSRNLEELKQFHRLNGHLPTSTSHGRIYTWLLVQRRSWREGVMAAARTELLSAVPGALPVEAHGAAA